MRATDARDLLDREVQPLLDAIAERIRTRMGNRAARRYLSVPRLISMSRSTSHASKPLSPGQKWYCLLTLSSLNYPTTVRGARRRVGYREGVSIAVPSCGIRMFAGL